MRPAACTEAAYELWDGLRSVGQARLPTIVFACSCSSHFVGSQTRNSRRFCMAPIKSAVPRRSICTKGLKGALRAHGFRVAL